MNPKQHKTTTNLFHVAISSKGFRKRNWLFVTAFLFASLCSVNTNAQQWQTNGSNICNTNPGHVGIGTTTPQAPLHVVCEATTAFPQVLTLERTNGFPGIGGITMYRDQIGLSFSRVGINTVSPGATLDVNGPINTSSGYSLGGTNIFANDGSFLTVAGGYTGGMRGVHVTAGRLGPVSIAALFVYPNNASEIGIITRGASSQTADLQQWQNIGGTVLATVDAAGNFGIGTANPVDKLEVVGTIRTDAIRFPDGSIQTTAGGGGGGGTDDLGNHIATQNIQLNGHWLSGDGEDEGVFVGTDGHVGIGTSTPAASFHVNSDLSTAGTHFTLTQNSNELLEVRYDPGSGANIMEVSGARLWVGPFSTPDWAQFTTAIRSYSSLPDKTALGLQYNGDSRLLVTLNRDGSQNVMDADGRLGIGTTNPTEKVDVNGTVRATAFVGDGSGLTGLSGGNSQWTDVNGGINYDNGNVGIGLTAPPTESLEVNGKTRTTELQVSQGAMNGYVLQSDAQGNVQWVAPSSLAVGLTSVPYGMIAAFNSPTCPDGWEEVTGAQGRFIMGAGTFTEGDSTYNYYLGDIGGEAMHQLTVDEMPSHTHELAFYAGTEPGNNRNVAGGGNMRQTTPTGGDQAHENRPPYVAYKICSCTDSTGASNQPATIWALNGQHAYYNAGNVGIGTNNPQAKLAVNGKVAAKEVKVELIGWPDYVFEKEYKLQPLEEVASYIRENKHLPGIPSAERVSKEGLDLGAMNVRLLEKIEELTLHIIEQNRRLEALERKPFKQ